MESEECMKKGLAAVLLGVLFAFTAEAATVSLLVIETGVSYEQGVKQQSWVWENVLLDTCFDAGHVVVNSPLMRFQSKTHGEFPEEAEEELHAARDWGADFFIVALLDYESGAQAPREIALKLFRVSPYQKIYEQHFSGKRYSTAKEESDNLKIIARGLVPHLTDR